MVNYDRKKQNDLVLFGNNSLETILHNQIDLVEEIIYRNKSDLYFVESLIKKYKNKIRLKEDEALFKNLSKASWSNPQIITIVRDSFLQKKYMPIKDFLAKHNSNKNTTVVALFDIDYEDNLGSIIRTCYAFDVKGIIISNNIKSIYAPNVGKAAMGANYLIDIVKGNFMSLLKTMKQEHYEVIGLNMDGENLPKIGYNSRTCYLFGSEKKGISKSILRKCDIVGRIPMFNNMESLNISNSVGIALYDKIAKSY